MMYLYDTAYLLGLAVGWPLLLWRRITRGPGSLALRARLGNLTARPVSSRCIWIHGVSLGEINATRTLVAELHRRSPDTAIVISSTTRTGLDRARELYPRLTVFRFPVDLSFALKRVFDRMRPTVIVLMELEVWPNLVEVARARGVPVIIANGRATEDKTMKRLAVGPLRPLARRMFRSIRWVGAQDRANADRFERLGVSPERIDVCGSLKFDGAEIADRLPGQDALAEQMTIDGDRPLLVCGSTGPDEEALLLEVYGRLVSRHPDLQLALVPRKPERFDEVAALIAGRGYACVRRSRRETALAAGKPDQSRTVFLGDTMGELRLFYALATVVFVGRTLIPLGGSDVMEPAGLAKPILVGPHTENFEEPTRLLAQAGGCVRCANPDELERELARLLTDPVAAAACGQAGRAVVEAQRGATEKTVQHILEFAYLTD